jgi:hypothetical protein
VRNISAAKRKYPKEFIIMAGDMNMTVCTQKEKFIVLVLVAVLKLVIKGGKDSFMEIMQLL